MSGKYLLDTNIVIALFGEDIPAGSGLQPESQHLSRNI